jgi:CheY-like chemotaxis protein
MLANIGPSADTILPRRILLIEDDEEFADICAAAIRASSHSFVEVANDPFEAINYISEGVYDLIITDWNLPAINGFNALKMASKSLDRDPSSHDLWFARKTPVVLLTVSDLSVIGKATLSKDHFSFLGAVSKSGTLSEILRQISGLFHSFAQTPLIVSPMPRRQTTA